jgi:hypothetical protein
MYSNPNYGLQLPATVYDPAIMTGWGTRPYNWEFSASVQQELLPRVSASVGYFRRIFGNFNVQDNEALGPNDFKEFSVVIPAGSAFGTTLPGAGQTLGGFYDQNINPIAKQVLKDAGQFGDQKLHWNGVDVSVDARLRSGVYLQGGVSVGKTMSDICEIVDDVPEALSTATVPTGVQSLVATGVATGWTPKGYCHQETPFQPQWKALATYTLPFAIRVAGTFQSIPGPQLAANTIYSNANTTAGLTTLGRNFTTATTATLNVVEPGTLYGDRLNQFDIRFTKVVPVRFGKVDLNVDIFNAFNSDAVLSQQNTFGAANAGVAGGPASAWTQPLSIIQPRFVKFSARWDF